MVAAGVPLTKFNQFNASRPSSAQFDDRTPDDATTVASLKVWRANAILDPSGDQTGESSMLRSIASSGATRASTRLLRRIGSRLAEGTDEAVRMAVLASACSLRA